MDPAPQTHLVLFARGVIAVLNAWPVLRIAVSESWGGPQSAQKRSWIASNILDAFESSPLDEEQIEDLLLESMVEEFETEIDDGSSLLVAKDILNVWKAASIGDTEYVLKLESAANKLAQSRLPTTRQGGNGDDEWVDEEGSGDEVSEGENEAPALRSPRPVQEPVVDEDGFELVQKGGKRKGH